MWSWQPCWPLTLPTACPAKWQASSACGWMVLLSSLEAAFVCALLILLEFSFSPTDDGLFLFRWQLLVGASLQEGTLALQSPSQVCWGLKVAFSSRYAELENELKIILSLYGKTFFHSPVCLQNCIGHLGYWWSLVYKQFTIILLSVDCCFLSFI